MASIPGWRRPWWTRTSQSRDVTEAGKLLTLTTAEAVQLGYARVVDDWDTLMLSIGATGAPVHETEVNWAERLVRFLTHPVVAPLLLSLGFFGVIIELRAPGLGLPGAVGVLALALFFGSHLLIGLAGLEAVLLFAAGVVLIGIEVFVIPGLGLVGFLGFGSLLAGLYMSLDRQSTHDRRLRPRRGHPQRFDPGGAALVLAVPPSASGERPAGALGGVPQAAGDARHRVHVGGPQGRPSW